MKKTLSLVIFCFCFLYMASVSTFAMQVGLDTENIPEDVKTKLTSIYYQSKSAMTGGEIGLL